MEGRNGPSENAGAGVTVLVVDDDVRLLKLVAEMLTALGHRVITASSPSEALATFQEACDEIEVVLSDVRMPGMKGPELVTRLCAKKPELRAVFMTGYGDGITIPGLVIEKPFRMADLQAGVARARALDGTTAAPRRMHQSEAATAAK